MASPNHGILREKLSRLLETTRTQAERSQARSALMWLSHSQRPLRAHELWVAVRAEESADAEHVERLLVDEHAYVGADKAAATNLRDLLGNLVTFTPDPSDPSKVNISPCDPGLRTYLAHIAGTTTESGPVASLAFSDSEAHLAVARTCMVICSVSTLHLARARHGEGSSSLILYAWSHWSAHLSLSGYPLADDNVARLADSMILCVSTDVLVFLLTLNDFVTGQLEFSSGGNRLECVAKVQMAQRALQMPMTLLSAIVRHQGYVKTLHKARQVLEASKDSLAGSRSTPSGRADTTHDGLLRDSRTRRDRLTASSKIGTLGIDDILAETESLFGETERKVVRDFAEVARGLGSVCVAFAGFPALYEQLCRRYDGGWSPMDVLVNASNFMEALASYPYWQRFPREALQSLFTISDTNDENYEAAQFVLEKLRPADISTPPREGRLSPPSYKTDLSGPPAGISPARWYAATAVERVTGLWSRANPNSTFTLNSVRPSLSNPSSFATFPTQAYTSDASLRLLCPLFPKSLWHLYRRRISPSIARIAGNPDLSSTGATAGKPSPNPGPLLKASLLADGYVAAATYIGIAILLNHVRRTLFPWLGAYMFNDPLEDLRLVLTRSDVFLDQTLSFTWPWLIFSHAQRLVWDVLGGTAMEVLLADGDAGHLSAPPSTRRHRATMQAVKVGYLVWTLATAEYVFARTLNAVSLSVAIQRWLLTGDKNEQIALRNVLIVHSPKISLAGSQLAVYVFGALLPLAYRSVVGAVWRRQPGMLLVIASAVAGCRVILRYRSRLYIALQMVGMFVALGFAAVAGLMLVVEFVADPLGLGDSTVLARRRGVVVKEGLGMGKRPRGGILAGGGKESE